MKRNIEVRWKRGTAAGYTDVFPVDEFAKSLVGAERVHLVRGPRGGKHSARFRLTIDGRHVEMNYSAFSEYNKRQGMERGIMRVRFADAKRTRAQILWWNGERISSADAQLVTVSLKGPSSPGELAAQAQRVDAKVLLRPGQIEFRRKLDLIYGSKCCVSGCTVSWALEAAHIDPYRSTHSDSPSNGLLLRRDLHGLFDSGHLAVDPQSKEVSFSAEAREWGGYGDLHRMAVLSAPQPGFESDAPNPAALGRRWSRFLRACATDE